MENGHGGSAHAEDGKTERHLAYLCIDNADEACVSTETRESESLHPTALNVQPDSPLDTVTIVRDGSGVVAVADPLGQLKSLYNTVSGCTVSAIDEPHNTAPVLPSSSEVAEESSAHLATSDSSDAMSGHSAARLPTPEQESRTECHTDQSLLLISEETAPAESCDLFGAAVLRDSAWPQNTPAVADNNTQKDSLLQLEFRTEGLPPGDSLPTGDPHQDQAQQIVLERCVPDELEHSHDAMACALVTNSESKSKALDCMQPLNTPQVHVISDFWEEMEKLTINDILYIKLMDSGQQPQGPFLHDATMTDVSDTSDSGYFTHLEDSPDKPDLSSGNDISMFSDFEEFSQTQDSSTDPTLEPQDTPVQTSMQELSYHKGEVWEGESGEIPSISRSEAPCFPGSTRTKGIKKIYKNVSVQDLRALETEPEQRLVSRCVSLQTRLSEAEESCSSFGDPLNPDVDHVHIGGESESSSRSEIPPQPYFSPAAATESYMISVPEIFEYLFDVQGATGSGVSFANEDVSKKSIPEMYDYFFSEFETESFFFPIIQGSESDQNEPIPIFSSSSCSDKVLPVPEVYDSFFEGVPEAGVEDQEDSGPIRVVTRVDHCTGTPSAVSGPDAYEHFFTDRDLDQSFFWRNLMSLRGRRFLRRTEGTGDGHQSSSSAAEDGKKGSVCRKKGPAKGWEKRDDDCPPMALSFLKEQILRHLEEQGKRGTDSRTALAMPRKESFLLSVNQSDMCLVCIAFASWVLKSSNPQAADAWKAALLANVSAISAIRYLRRYVKKGKPADVP
ncbi:PERM1 protein, partial [Amia calva]|nr:PERM1 protein [Amia calva]